MEYKTDSIADRIQAIADERSETVASILRESHVNKSFINNLRKRGAMPAADALGRIADYVGCTVDYLLCRTDVAKQELAMILSEEEKTIIDRYRFVDSFGKEAIRFSCYSEYRQSLEKLARGEDEAAEGSLHG